MREAVRQLRAGQPRPVGIEIAHDVLSTVADVELIAPPPARTAALPLKAARSYAPPPPLRGALSSDLRLGGVLAARASSALREVAERLQAPVVMSDNGRGALSDRHPLALNTLGGRAVFPHADVVLVVGSRFVEVSFGRPAWPAEGKSYVFLNSNTAVWGPPRSCEVGVHADARLGLEALAAELSTRKTSRTAELEKVRAWVSQQANDIAPQSAWTRALRAAIPDEGVLVMDLTQVGYFARLMMRYQPNTFITPATRARWLWLSRPGSRRRGQPRPRSGQHHWRRRLRLNMQELATARKYDFVWSPSFNDGYFGNVRTMGRSTRAEFGVKLRNPRFDKLAEAFDIPFARVEIRTP